MMNVRCPIAELKLRACTRIPRPARNSPATSVTGERTLPTDFASLPCLPVSPRNLEGAGVRELFWIGVKVREVWNLRGFINIQQTTYSLPGFSLSGSRQPERITQSPYAEMKRETRRTIQIALAVALVTAGARLALIYHSRHAPDEREEQRKRAQAEAEKNFNPDYYVVPKKLHLYSVKDAKAQLSNQTVWVRDGYYHTYFPYDPARHRVDFKKDVGLLAPLEKLHIVDVVQASSPEGVPQVVAVFDKDAKQYAFSLGAVDKGDTRIYADDILFYQDPHELYKHWSAGTWQAIEQHQVKNGMDELQVAFAVGAGRPQASNDSSHQEVVYPNDGKPVVVVFRNGKVAEIRQGS